MRVNPMKGKIVEGEKTIVHNIHILDRSGSMAYGKYENAVMGINEELALLKKDESVEYLQTIVEFDSEGHWGSESARIVWRTTAAPLKSYGVFVGLGASGGTPLYETIGIVIEKMRGIVKDGEKVLLKIFTDGDENSSKNGWGAREGGAHRLQLLIKEVEALGFTVTFVGQDRDVKQMIKNVGLRTGNTISHDNTARGVKMSFTETAGATMTYSKKVAAGEDALDNFYSKSVEEA